MNGTILLAGASALAAMALAACGGASAPTAASTVGATTTTSQPTTTTVNGMGAMGGSNMSGTNSLPKTSAHVSSVTLTGTIAKPLITVAGSGFGARPAPYPATAPQGQSGCPPAPTTGDGYLYANNLLFKDPNTNTGFIAGEDAGGQFDCVGIVIDSWSPTRVVFGLGNLYDKHIPQNYYVLSHGDPFSVYVKGAAGTGMVSLS
ncbi:MAG: hypothetical protein ACRDY2_04240 [Acidimicrobiales bacterium]